MTAAIGNLFGVKLFEALPFAAFDKHIRLPAADMLEKTVTRYIVKNKKLLIIIAVAVGVVVLAVLLGVMFSVNQADVTFFCSDGTKYIVPQADLNPPSADDVLSLARGKSVFTLNKSQLIGELNKKYTGWTAVGVVISFPNKINVYFVYSEVCAKVATSSTVVYIDIAGNIVDHREGVNCIDITSAFNNKTVVSTTIGDKLDFGNSGDNGRLQQVLQAISAMWQLQVDYEQMPQVFGASGVFTFDEYGDMHISVKNTATIVIKSPSEGEDIGSRVIKGFSVYFNADDNLQTSGVVITVTKDGRVTTEGIK